MRGPIPLLALILPAVAGAAPDDVERVGNPSADAVEMSSRLAELTVEVERLRREAAVLNEAGLEDRGERQGLEALLRSAGGLMDPRTGVEQRALFALELARSGHADAPLLLLGAARSVDESVAMVGISALGASGSMQAPALLEAILLERWGDASDETRIAVVHALGAHDTPQAGAALYRAVQSGELPGSVQRAALTVLETNYSALLAERGLPKGRTERGVGPLVAVSSAGAGGVVLSSIGVWGRSDVAVTVGALGGAGIGAGLGGLWASTESLSAGQGLRYSSDVIWGITGGVLAHRTIFDGPTYESQSRAGPNFAALLRATGASAGAASGAWQARHGTPDRQDVLEQDLAGFLGLMSGRAVGQLSGEWVRERSQGESYRYYQTTDRAVQGGSLAGAALGLGGAALVRESWEASWTDVGLGAVGSVQMMTLLGSAHQVSGRQQRPGATRLGFGLGGLGGLALAEAVDPTPAQVGMAAWGGGLGHALGAGVPLLAGVESGQVVAGSTLSVGLLGTVGGGLSARALPLDRGDVALTGFAVPLAAIEGAAIGAWAEDRELGFTSEQVGGLVLTGSAVTGAVTTALGPHIAPSPGDVGMVASTTAWGAYHGLLVPLALDVKGRPSDLVLASVLTADGFLVAGSVLASPAVDLDPRRTLVPQLAGLGGATLGSLGALMVRDDGTSAARGALIGSTLGFVAGGVVESRRTPPADRNRTAVRRLRLPDLPGDWSVVAAPMPTAEGSAGAYAEVRAFGW